MKILVFVEKYQDEIKRVSLELISRAREIADENNQEVISLLISNKTDDARMLISQGADKVIIVKSDEYKNFESISFTNIFKKVIEKYSPDVVFVGATENGRDLAARVTAKMSLGLTADCIDIKFQDDKFHFVRPTFDGKLLSSIYCSTKPEFATVSPRTFSLHELDENRKGEIIEESEFIEKISNGYSIDEITIDETLSQNIEYAEKIVSCGRGIGSQENLKIIGDFAKSIGASLAVTRPLVQKGWANQNIQVGSSGKTVTPKLYIALGISGARHHTAGMNKSEIIIAVNKDENAEIFNTAHFGIVGDLFEALPLLQKKLGK